MTVSESVDLFVSEMINEIGHLNADETIKDQLIEAVKEVAKTVLATHKSGQK